MADAHSKKHETLMPFLDHLRALPFVDDVALDDYENSQGEGAPIDGLQVFDADLSFEEAGPFVLGPRGSDPSPEIRRCGRHGSSAPILSSG